MNSTDKNFDGLAKRFARNIYGSNKGKIREAVLWQDLQPVLNGYQGKKLRILDAGGGQGQFSRKLAELGHEVVLLDHSKEMLTIAELESKQSEAPLAITFCHSSIQDFVSGFESQNMAQFDLVLCHAVLEWLAQPKETLLSLLPLLKEGGEFSLLFYNKTGLLFHSLVVGNFDYVERGLKKGGRRQRKLTPTTPHEINEVRQWTQEAGMVERSLSGVRCIHDYMRLKEHQQISFEQILQMELRYCQHPDFVPVARYIHLLLHKP